MAYIRLLIILIASTLILCWPRIIWAELKSNKNNTQTKPHTNKQKKNIEILREQNNIRICQQKRPGTIRPPRITISNVKQTSALKGGRYEISGIIDGVCLKEAGLYKNNERVFKFSFDTTPNYKRYDFVFEVLEDDNPEIRAFDINWQRSSKMLLKKNN